MTLNLTDHLSIQQITPNEESAEVLLEDGGTHRSADNLSFLGLTNDPSEHDAVPVEDAMSADAIPHSFIRSLSSPHSRLLDHDADTFWGNRPSFPGEFGKPSRDRLGGTEGDDWFHGQAGRDDLRGFDGDDTLLGGVGGDRLNGGKGNDSLMGNAGSDILEGRMGNDTLRGGKNSDVLTGGAGDDMMFGGGGRDKLYGGIGADLIRGGAGKDTLHGGPGTDTLIGGQGEDVFVLRLGEGIDHIVDFREGDRLLIRSDDLMSTNLIFPIGGSITPPSISPALPADPISLDEISLIAQGSGTVVRLRNQDLAILKGVTPEQLSDNLADFIDAGGIEAAWY